MIYFRLRKRNPSNGDTLFSRHTWQSRPLDAVYPIVYLDAIHLKMRSEGRVQNQAVYLALGINLDGHKELLGLWIGESEGAKFWLGSHNKHSKNTLAETTHNHGTTRSLLSRLR